MPGACAMSAARRDANQGEMRGERGGRLSGSATLRQARCEACDKRDLVGIVLEGLSPEDRKVIRLADPASM